MLRWTIRGCGGAIVAVAALCAAPSAVAGPGDHVRLGNTVIDFKRLEAYCGTRRVELTDREFEILHCLAERAGHVVTRDELLHLVWGYADAPLTRTVDNFIVRLRRYLEDEPSKPRHLLTVRGVGYRFVMAE